jgi:hypothetical protein
MKKDKSSLHWILEYLPFIAILILAIILFNDLNSTPYCLVPCYGLGPSRNQKFLLYSEIVVSLSLIMIALSLFLKFYTNKSLIIMVLPILFWLFIIFLGAPFEALCPIQCAFPAGFTCVTFKLNAETSQLDLGLGQGLGNDIKITGIKCINTETLNLSTPTFIEPLSEFILLPSGKTVHFGKGTNNTIYCKNEDGSMPLDAHIGNTGCLRLYINYTDTATGKSHIISGRIVAKYEP